jgi:hypothetical protein
MDILEQYRQIIQSILTEYAAIPILAAERDKEKIAVEIKSF